MHEIVRTTHGRHFILDMSHTLLLSDLCATVFCQCAVVYYILTYKQHFINLLIQIAVDLEIWHYFLSPDNVSTMLP